MLIPTSNLWTVAVGLAVFVVATVTGVWAGLVMLSPCDEGVASITSVTAGSSGQGAGMVTIGYEYRVDGVRLTGNTQAQMAHHSEIRVGDTAKLFYLRQAPGFSSLFTVPRPVVWVIISAVLSAVGLMVAFQGFRKCRASQ